MTHWLKIMTAIPATVALAYISCVSIPVLSVIISENAFNKNAITLDEKIWATLPAWSFFAAFKTWLLWNAFARPIICPNNVQIPSETNHLEDDWYNLRVITALLANFPNFTNGFLVSYSLFAKKSIPLFIITGIVIGALNFITNMLTEVVIAFSEHAAYCAKQERHIKPLFKQPLVEGFYNRAKIFGILVRELFPPVTAIIRTVAGVTLLNELIAPKMLWQRLIIGLTSPFMYTGNAYLHTFFDVHYFRKNIEAMGEFFPLENALSRKSSKSLRALGNTLNGQILLNGLEKMGLPFGVSLLLTVSLSAWGFSALILNLLHQYISTNNEATIQHCDEAKMLCFFAGTEKTAQIGDTIEPFIKAASVGIAFFATAARGYKIYGNRSNEMDYTEQNQVRPSDELNEMDDTEQNQVRPFVVL